MWESENLVLSTTPLSDKLPVAVTGPCMMTELQVLGTWKVDEVYQRGVA